MLISTNCLFYDAKVSNNFYAFRLQFDVRGILVLQFQAINFKHFPFNADFNLYQNKVYRLIYSLFHDSILSY